MSWFLIRSYLATIEIYLIRKSKSVLTRRAFVRLCAWSSRRWIARQEAVAREQFGLSPEDAAQWVRRQLGPDLEKAEASWAKVARRNRKTR